jgi:5-methylcytosine-specific restriction protein A
MPTINKLKKAKRHTENSEKRVERQKYYNTQAWRKLRAEKLRQSPLCQDCLKDNIVTLATDVHHNVSFMSSDNEEVRQSLFFSIDNLVSLCRVCHKKRHNGHIIDDSNNNNDDKNKK